jgi:hypothetical protein
VRRKSEGSCHGSAGRLARKPDEVPVQAYRQAHPNSKVWALARTNHAAVASRIGIWGVSQKFSKGTTNGIGREKERKGMKAYEAQRRV